MIAAPEEERFVVEFNAAACHHFGYKKDKICGSHRSMLYADEEERNTTTMMKMTPDDRELSLQRQ
ncbi:MAG: hypothetical protein AMK70_05245 [Nitrospira bacterium SG8_35_1]|nr:MAG: hypothetical protein AMK70_05245 [Nitrospira bacterium SG8_35_1]